MLFKRCPYGGRHWFWARFCYCRYNEKAHGLHLIYDFRTGREASSISAPVTEEFLASAREWVRGLETAIPPDEELGNGVMYADLPQSVTKEAPE